MTIRFYPLLGAILLALLPAAHGETSRPASDPTLGWQIAQQGNRALEQIRAESRLALEPLVLPAPARNP